MLLSFECSMMPTQQLWRVAINQQGQTGPTIFASPDPAQTSRPAFIGCFGHRRQRLDARPEAHRTLAYLPALVLKRPLHCVLVHAQQMRRRTPGYVSPINFELRSVSM